VHTCSGRRSETCSARRPLARLHGLPGVLGGLHWWPRRVMHSVCNCAGLQHFCHIAACSAWVPGTMLDHLDREEEPSPSALPWPHQTTVIPLYSVTTVTARVKSATIQLSDRDIEDIVDGMLAMASAGRRDPRIHHLGMDRYGVRMVVNVADVVT